MGISLNMGKAPTVMCPLVSFSTLNQVPAQKKQPKQWSQESPSQVAEMHWETREGQNTQLPLLKTGSLLDP